MPTKNIYPFLFSVQEPAIDEPFCVTDADCPSKHACFGDFCKNPCLVIEPCVQNAECTVQDTLPARVMVCTCIPGFSGKGDVSCEPIQTPVEAGCQSDNECPATQACIQRSCVNPCSYQNPCAPQASCAVSNHRPTCTCPSGFTGDAFRACYPGTKYIYDFSYFFYFKLWF